MTKDGHPDVEYDRHCCDLMKNAVGMQSFGRLVNLAYHLNQTAQAEGDIVEFGCNQGNTGRLLVALAAPKKRVWLYDSFEGLPAPTETDGIAADDLCHQRGSMAVPPCEVPGATVVKGWFRDLTLTQLPHTISFAHLDGDLYESISDSLNLVLPRLSEGAVCFIDDFFHPRLPGIREALLVHFQNYKLVMDTRGERAQHVYLVKQ